MDEIDLILAENVRRNQRLHADWDPISGRGSVGERVKWRGLHVPASMLADPRLAPLLRSDVTLNDGTKLQEDVPLTEKEARIVDEVRIEYDFPYWAAMYVRIKPKDGGDDVNFVLNYAQRKLVALLEGMRLDNRPIRLIMLKARQWGGSTCCQVYMAWLQLVHKKGLNSLIIAHQSSCTSELKDMFDRLILNYPRRLLYLGEEIDQKAKVLTAVGRTGAISRVPQRNCKIKLGTAERPNSCRGGDYSLVHLSEVGMWKKTMGKKPEEIVRSACSGVLYKPLTMVVYESTANGTENFFHREYTDACRVADAQFRPIFVGWHEIEQNSLPFASEAERYTFAKAIYEQRDATDANDSRHDSGKYNWWLWQQGATLEGIRWYMLERSKHTLHDSMAAECPTDDIEAFANSKANVFGRYEVELLRQSCKPPMHTGEVVSARGRKSVSDLSFRHSTQGRLQVWEMPEDKAAKHRYLAVVDIGGVSDSSDWSVIAVFDRSPLLDTKPIKLVAQWYGHAHMTDLAWCAARIAAWYGNAYLVIESNTIETRDANRDVEENAAPYLLQAISDVYNNVYQRKSKTEEGKTIVRHGFHTNASTKPLIINGLIDAVLNQEWEERDERCLNELLSYERKPNGQYGAVAGAHDDLLMTRAIALHISRYEMKMVQRAEVAKKTYPLHKIYGEVNKNPGVW